MKLLDELQGILFDKYKRRLPAEHPTDAVQDDVVFCLRKIIGRDKVCYLYDEPVASMNTFINRNDLDIRRSFFQAEEAERRVNRILENRQSTKHLCGALASFDRDVLTLVGLRALFPDIHTLTLDAFSEFYRAQYLAKEREMTFFYRWLDVLTAFGVAVVYVAVVTGLHHLSRSWFILTYLLAVGLPIRLLLSRALRRPFRALLIRDRSKEESYISRAFLVRSDSWRKFWSIHIFRFIGMMVAFAVWAASISRLFPHLFSSSELPTTGLSPWLWFAVEIAANSFSLDLLDLFDLRLGAIEASNWLGKFLIYMFKLYVVVILIDSLGQMIRRRLSKEVEVF